MNDIWILPLGVAATLIVFFLIFRTRLAPEASMPDPPTGEKEKSEPHNDLLKKVRAVEFTSKRLVDSVFSGEYHSAFKGMGMEFSEVRPYAPGDDVRSIDWNVTARMGEPFLKVFEEERELTVVLMVDASASGNFGTVEKFKSEAAVEVCATLAFSAIRNNDKVGLFIFTDKVELHIPPRKGRSRVLRIIRELLAFSPTGRGTNIKAALNTLSKSVKKRAIVFLVSDFQDHGFEQSLRAAARKHDVIAIRIYDPVELTIPDAGMIRFSDAETGEETVVDSSDTGFRERYERESLRREARTLKMLSSCHIDTINISTAEPVSAPLEKFFKQREKRMARGR